MNVRDLSVFLNRDRFVRDEFEVDSFSQTRRNHTLRGHVVSSGETLSTGNEEIIIPGGLDRRRRLVEENRLVGHRFPILYLPAKGFWGFVDLISRFRVISAEEFESANGLAPWVWLGVGVAIWTSGILLLRRGIRLAKSSSVRTSG